MKVQVLLSAYNGEAFLKEQIDSILAQEGADVSLLVRNDGSTDKTEAILKAYGDKIKYYSDKNIGVKASFFDLIKKAPSADFYAFSDQDDFWLNDKLISAVNMLKGSQGFALYFSNLTIADQSLNPLSCTSIKYLPTLGSCLAQNPATGCTIVINRPLLELLKNTPDPQAVSMHDTFVFRLAAAVGAEICFDPTPHILYRQHKHNLLGSRGPLKRLIHYFSFFISGKGFSRPDEAALLIKTAGKSLTDEGLSLLMQVIAYKYSSKTKLNLIKNKSLKTPSPMTNFITALALLLNRF